MSLANGTKLGPYEIVSPLGAGGMGEVYLATDGNLKRSVAIKVLPAPVASDAERLARFQREAEVLAALNHPNIGAIYGLEKTPALIALVMELVEGPTLADRLTRGRIEVDEVLAIARQIAEALEAAHERGIIHRDLKPANIKVRGDGTVKVLDFGLAKAIDGSGGSGEPGTAGGFSMSPTLTSPAVMTGVGMILGTAADMAPEQARGRAVDKRADLWAFGCVLYEMLSETRPFAGDDVGETLATVIKGEPDWNRLPPDTSATIRTLLRRCLRKDPRQRLPDAGAVRIEIEDAIAAPMTVATAPPRPDWKRVALVAGPAALAILIVGAIAGWRFGGTRASETRHDVARLVLPLASGTELADGGSAVISPDGTLVAYVSNRGGIYELYTRPLNAVDARLVTGARGAVNPFFSPDGHWLAFFADGKLKKVSTSGGVVVALADAVAGVGSGAWGPDDTIVFNSPRGLAAVPASGGEPHLLPVSDQDGPVRPPRLPEFLPGSEALLVASGRAGAVTVRDLSIDVLNLKTGRRKTIIQGSPYAHYLPTGHVIFLRDGTLMAVPFDAQTLELTGTPVEVLTGVRQQQYTGTAAFSCSRTGTCVYSAGGTAAARTLAIVDRAGSAQPLPFPPKPYATPRFSPGGDRLVWWVEQLRCDIEIADLARGTITRVTSEGDNHFPLWTPDGAGVTYLAQKDRNGYAIVSRPANGSGAESTLLSMRGLSPVTPLTWSPGGVLAFADRGDIWILPRTGEPRPFAPSPFAENAPAFSPDGRWLAYVSDESGRYEIYVRPFPGPGEKYVVSTGGGLEPVWSRSSRELFFRNGDQVLAVQVGATAAFSASRPAVLFTGAFARARNPDRISYDVSPDGKHFVMLNSGEEDRAVTQISVLLNWFDELKARVPVK